MSQNRVVWVTPERICLVPTPMDTGKGLSKILTNKTDNKQVSLLIRRTSVCESFFYLYFCSPIPHISAAKDNKLHAEFLEYACTNNLEY